MYHYQQIKCETKTEDWSTSDQYMRVIGRYGNGKSKNMQDREEQSELGRKACTVLIPHLTMDLAQFVGCCLVMVVVV